MKRLKRILFILGAVILATIIWFNAAPQLGAQIKDIKMDKIEKSKYYKNGRFINLEETEMMTGDESMLKTMRKFMQKGDNRIPESPVPTHKFDADKFIKENDGISVTWFGHSTVLLNIDGVVILNRSYF